MTDVIEAARRILAAVQKSSNEDGIWYELTGDDFIGLKEPYEVATELLRLAEPEWGEPTAEHDGVACWVEGVSARMPLIVHRDDAGRWLATGVVPSDQDGEWSNVRIRLNGRRVAPCVGRPQAKGART